MATRLQNTERRTTTVHRKRMKATTIRLPCGRRCMDNVFSAVIARTDHDNSVHHHYTVRECNDGILPAHNALRPATRQHGWISSSYHCYLLQPATRAKQSIIPAAPATVAVVAMGNGEVVQWAERSQTIITYVRWVILVKL